MNEKLLQKKGKIISQIAVELLGKEVNDRMLSIMYYQQKFNTSQGTIQNAINFLKEKKAIELVNRGFQGSYITAIDYTILQEYCNKINIVGYMPIPRSTRLEVLASFIHKKLQGEGMDFQMHYIQSVMPFRQMLLQNQCDFIVCPLAMAKQWVEEDFEIIIDFGIYSLLSHPVIVQTNKKISKIGVIDTNIALSEVGLNYAKKHNCDVVKATRSKVLTAFYNQEIQAFIDEKEEVNFLLNKDRISLEDIDLIETRAVLIVRKNRLDIQRVLNDKLSIDGLEEMYQEFENGSLEIKF